MNGTKPINAYNLVDSNAGNSNFPAKLSVSRLTNNSGSLNSIANEAELSNFNSASDHHQNTQDSGNSYPTVDNGISRNSPIIEHDKRSDERTKNTQNHSKVDQFSNLNELRKQLVQKTAYYRRENERAAKSGGAAATEEGERVAGRVDTPDSKNDDGRKSSFTKFQNGGWGTGKRVTPNHHEVSAPPASNQKADSSIANRENLSTSDMRTRRFDYESALKEDDKLQFERRNDAIPPKPRKHPVTYSNNAMIIPKKNDKEEAKVTENSPKLSASILSLTANCATTGTETDKPLQSSILKSEAATIRKNGAASREQNDYPATASMANATATAPTDNSNSLLRERDELKQKLESQTRMIEHLTRQTQTLQNSQNISDSSIKHFDPTHSINLEKKIKELESQVSDLQEANEWVATRMRNSDKNNDEYCARKKVSNNIDTKLWSNNESLFNLNAENNQSYMNANTNFNDNSQNHRHFQTSSYETNEPSSNNDLAYDEQSSFQSPMSTLSRSSRPINRTMQTPSSPIDRFRADTRYRYHSPPPVTRELEQSTSNWSSNNERRSKTPVTIDRSANNSYSAGRLSYESFEKGSGSDLTHGQMAMKRSLGENHINKFLVNKFTTPPGRSNIALRKPKSSGIESRNHKTHSLSNLEYLMAETYDLLSTTKSNYKNTSNAPTHCLPNYTINSPEIAEETLMQEFRPQNYGIKVRHDSLSESVENTMNNDVYQLNNLTYLPFSPKNPVSSKNFMQTRNHLGSRNAVNNYNKHRSKVPIEYSNQPDIHLGQELVLNSSHHYQKKNLPDNLEILANASEAGDTASILSEVDHELTNWKNFQKQQFEVEQSNMPPEKSLKSTEKAKRRKRRSKNRRDFKKFGENQENDDVNSKKNRTPQITSQVHLENNKKYNMRKSSTSSDINSSSECVTPKRKESPVNKFHFSNDSLSKKAVKNHSKPTQFNLHMNDLDRKSGSQSATKHRSKYEPLWKHQKTSNHDILQRPMSTSNQYKYSDVNRFDTLGKLAISPLSAEDIHTGDLVKFTSPEGHVSRGLVHYIGRLPGRSEIYLGLELDKDDGRHDGIYEGVRYFTCKKNKGIFVVFTKIIMLYRNANSSNTNSANFSSIVSNFNI